MSNSETSVFTIKINLGKPVLVSDINISIYGDAKDDPDYKKIIEDSKLFIGKNLNHDDYNYLKNKLYNFSIFKGYFDAKFQNNQLIVIPSDYKSIWNINFFSDKKYVFGSVKFYGSQIRLDYLKKISNIDLKKNYDFESIIELNRRLAYTNWFSSIFITPSYIKYDNNDRFVELDVFVVPQNKNSIETRIGYTTDMGIREQIIWKKPWINLYGHGLEASFSQSYLEQIFYLNYKIPSPSFPLEKYFFFQGELKNENLGDTKFSVINSSIAYFWSDYINNWQRVINLNWNLNKYIKNNITNKFVLIYPSVNFNRVRQYGNNMMPYKGNSQRYSIYISNVFWKSDINFFIFQVQNTWIRTFFKNNRFLIFNNATWINTNNFSSIVPTLRFLLNKNYNFRGYKNPYLFSDIDYIYKRNFFGLIINSFEHQYNIFNKFWVAHFLDFGKISNNIIFNKFRIGTGVGIRWELPIGPVKFDVAIPLEKNNKIRLKLFHFYINLGPEL